MIKLKVLLVYPNLQMVNLLPTNISTLSAYLKEADIDVKVFDTTFYRTTEKSVDEIRVEHMQLRPFNLKDKGIDYKETDVFEDFKKMVDEYKPDIIGVTATDDTFELGMSLVAKVRDKKIHTIVGGVFATFAPEEAINNENVDSICVGEGEETVLELCRKLENKGDITDIKNLWVKVNGKIYKNGIRSLIDINSIPYEDFSVFEKKRFFRPMQGKIYRMIPVSLDRGCPYNCTFCAAPVLKGLYRNSGEIPYFRVKTISRVMEELIYQVEKYRADYIYFNSETFFARKEEDIELFAKEYASKIGLPFWCQTRIETITEKRIKMLADMNCDRISIGLEHGNEEFRKKILKKNFTNKQVINAFEIIEKSGIPITVNNIIGFPDETREIAFDTIRLNRHIHADSINAYFFVPYRGTPLRQYCIERGYLRPDAKTDSLMRSSILNMPQFTSDQIKGLVRTFPLYIKMPESYFKKIKIAEQLNQEGDEMLAGLREIYFKEYFK
ncbi:MAG TPA: B12-binding domain-containing radical SAM protein [Candidatus Wunengus sp. YC65]|uniref:B12-binding domain-containing radical SAM protein n=1 Tax=Candidatus Wunengus sp. YC65 TaxID=3367701 RepID=UPI00402879ED